MINGITKIDCGSCHGAGYIFHGDNEDYHIEPCACVSEEAAL